jgi:hypothetical protein
MMMSSQEAVTEVFITAFKTLPYAQQKAVLAKMFKMRRWKKDLIDIAIAETRNREKSRPFRNFLAA